jgi:hypothetical protein
MMRDPFFMCPQVWEMKSNPELPPRSLGWVLCDSELGPRDMNRTDWVPVCQKADAII